MASPQLEDHNKKAKEDRPGSGTRFWIDRGIFSSDIWFASPWKLKVWIYLIGNANHKDGVFMGVSIKRGQILRSLRTVAKECAYMIGYRLKKPSVETIRRIYEELTKDGRIEQRTVQQGTLVTILNYESFQSIPNNEQDDEVDDEQDNSETMARHNNNVNNETKRRRKQPVSPQKKTSPTKTEPPLITIPLVSGKEYPICQSDITEWQETYPAVDVSQKLREIRQWNINNPQRRKTERGIRTHICGWLAKEQNKGRGQMRLAQTGDKPHGLPKEFPY